MTPDSEMTPEKYIVKFASSIDNSPENGRLLAASYAPWTWIAAQGLADLGKNIWNLRNLEDEEVRNALRVVHYQLWEMAENVARSTPAMVVQLLNYPIKPRHEKNQDLWRMDVVGQLGLTLTKALIIDLKATTMTSVANWISELDQ